MQSLKTDLEQDEVFVFTPKGRVITLPVGGTAGWLRRAEVFGLYPSETLP